MEIVETSVFSRRIESLLSGSEYRSLQHHLVETPDAGNIIPGSGGIRKIRWAMKGRGKRGGARIIYYWAVSRDRILMLYAFSKNERSDITKDQLSILREIVQSEFKHEG